MHTQSRAPAVPARELQAFNTNSAAALLDIPPASLRARIRAGTVRAARIGQRWYIPATEMQRLLTPTAGQQEAEAAR